jgi:hypothetical protein
MDRPKHRIIITISPGGKTASRVEGIAGPSCGQVTAWLNGLGQVVHTEDTPEAYLHETTEVSSDETIKTGDEW